MTNRPESRRTILVVTVACVVSLAAAVVLYLYVHPLVALGFAGGFLTGAGMFSALVFVLGRTVVPASARSGPVWPYALLHAGKFVLAAGFAFLIIVVLEAHAGAFAGGYTVALITLLVLVGAGQHTGQRPTAGRNGV